MIANNLLTFDTTYPVTGLQTGNGINVDTGSSALIVGNTVTEYQKTGIRINGTGTCATLINNTVTGVGPTSILAQNGIQISRGATAAVENNTVTNNDYTGAGAASAGILLFEEIATAPVCVQFNTTSSNDLGIALASTVSALVQGNNSSNNNDDGIFVDSTSINNVFIQNTALGNGVYDIEDLSVGLLSALTGNIYLCNTCVNDNKDEICSSTSPFPPPEMMTTAAILATFVPPATVTGPITTPE